MCKTVVCCSDNCLVWRLVVGAAGSGVGSSLYKVDWLGAGNRKSCVGQGVQGEAVCQIQVGQLPVVGRSTRIKQTHWSWCGICQLGVEGIRLLSLVWLPVNQ